MERVPRDREGRPARSRGLTVFGKGVSSGAGAPAVAPPAGPAEGFTLTDGTTSLDLTDGTTPIEETDA